MKVWAVSFLGWRLVSSWQWEKGGQLSGLAVSYQLATGNGRLAFLASGQVFWLEEDSEAGSALPPSPRASDFAKSYAGQDGGTGRYVSGFNWWGDRGVG
jgi:hypothetical protein